MSTQLMSGANRRTMAPQGGTQLSSEIAGNPTFESITQELGHLREVQAQMVPYIYVLTGTVVGQSQQSFILTIEQGADFKCQWITGSMFSFDTAGANASTFPLPNALGVQYWAARGLSADITDSRSGNKLTSGFVPMELFCSPGYGLNFQNLFPWRYLFMQNNKLKFDIRNRDNATRTHEFNIALIGHRILTPS